MLGGFCFRVSTFCYVCNTSSLRQSAQTKIPGKAIDGTVEQTGKTMEDAGDKIDDAVEGAGQAIEDAGDKLKDVPQ